MITFAFDESGQFENQEINDTLLIGGILYDDKGDPNDAGNERKRLTAFYKSACSEAGVEYPQGLHSKRDAGRDRQEGGRVRDLKKVVSDRLPEFLQKGTYNNGWPLYAEPRSGDYHPFILLKGKNGKASLLNTELNMLSRDDFASNIYIHMVEDVISRTVFHNPVVDVADVKFELATRVAVLGSEDPVKEQEYIKLGHDRKKKTEVDSKPIFYLTSIDLFRTAIEREMLYSDKRDMKVEGISVKNINYDDGDEDMAFLFLADSICSYIYYYVRYSTEGVKAGEILELVRRLAGREKALVFVYDDIDIYFDKAFRAYEEKDYYHSFSYIYDGLNCGSAYEKFYKKNWFSHLESLLRKETDYPMFAAAVDCICDYAHSNFVDQDRLLMIVNGLRGIAGNIDFPSEEDRKTLFALYDATATAFNHLGLSSRAEENAREAEKYLRYADNSVILSLWHKKTVNLCDGLKLEEALKTADEACGCAKEMHDVRCILLEDEGVHSVEYSKALSQLGQVYGYLRDSRAEEAFKKALSMAPAGSPNYKITQSYLMHFYIDRGMKEPYDSMMMDYAEGESGLRGQLGKLLEMGSSVRGHLISVKFALYCYVKGLYFFHLDDLGGGLLEDLSGLEALMEGHGYGVDAMSGHPWQIINKYLAFIFYGKGNAELADRIMDRKVFQEKTGDIIEAITLFGKAQYARIKGDADGCEEEAQRAFDVARRMNSAITHDEPMSYYDEMDGILTYTYR